VENNSAQGFKPTTYGLYVPARNRANNVLQRSSDPNNEGAHYNSELQQLIDAWPRISAAKRAVILALVAAPIG
jgi:hypothetical protein